MYNDNIMIFLFSVDIQLVFLTKKLFDINKQN